MSIKVVAWNMNNWARKGTDRVAAWNYLNNILAPDVALLQETAPPTIAIEPPPHLIYHEIEKLKWGTAVASFSPPITEITSARTISNKNDAPLIRTSPGALVVSRIAASSGQEITFVSMYGQFDYGYTVTTVQRLLSDITPLVDSPLGKYLIVGGDINVSSQYSAKDKHRLRHVNVLERFKSLGLIDCVDQKIPQGRGRLDGCTCVYGDECRHVRTQRHKHSSLPWENDYIFASKALAKKLISAKPWDEEGAWNLSDHCPIIATFDI
jgi:exonuclease III